MRYLLFGFIAVLAGCGSTRIISEDPNAEIFLNDRLVGIGEASVDRVGPPRHASLEARRSGKTVGRQEMRRSFSFKTILWGICSYYTGFYWGWYYPEYVRIPVEMKTVSNPAKVISPWNNPGESIWMQPLK